MNILHEVVIAVDRRFLGDSKEETRVTVEITGEEWVLLREAALRQVQNKPEGFSKGIG
jgi:hypothetical protein